MLAYIIIYLFYDTYMKGNCEMLEFFLSRFLSPALFVSVLGCGTFFLIRLKAFYILHPVKTLRGMLDGAKTVGESPFTSMSLALAGTLGVGNIVGVASAISFGGAGAVFWMWVGALFSMSLKYAEATLAVRYRKKRKNCYFGGAMYYMKDGLRGKKGKMLGGIFSVLCILNSLTTGTAIQVNAISESFEEIFGISSGVCSFMVALITVIALSWGIKNISSATAVIIPVASVVYIFASLYVISSDISQIPEILRVIMKGAFGIESITGGLLGYGIKEAVRYGISRGIISNEAGCGTSPTAHARADVKNPAQQGFWGVFEVFVDTVLLCSMTAFAILIYVNKNGFPECGSMSLTQIAYGSVLGKTGEYIIGASVFVFAAATVLCQYYYGMESLGYLTEKKSAVTVYTVMFFAAIFYGGIAKSDSVWQVTDLTVGVMTVINCSVLLRLSRDVVYETENYFGKNQKKKEAVISTASRISLSKKANS